MNNDKQKRPFAKKKPVSNTLTLLNSLPLRGALQSQITYRQQVPKSNRDSQPVRRKISTRQDKRKKKEETKKKGSRKERKSCEQRKSEWKQGRERSSKKKSEYRIKTDISVERIDPQDRYKSKIQFDTLNLKNYHCQQSQEVPNRVMIDQELQTSDSLLFGREQHSKRVQLEQEIRRIREDQQKKWEALILILSQSKSLNSEEMAKALASLVGVNKPKVKQDERHYSESSDTFKNLDEELEQNLLSTQKKQFQGLDVFEERIRLSRRMQPSRVRSHSILQDIQVGNVLNESLTSLRVDNADQSFSSLCSSKLNRKSLLIDSNSSKEITKENSFQSEPHTPEPQVSGTFKLRDFMRKASGPENSPVVEEEKQMELEQLVAHTQDQLKRMIEESTSHRPSLEHTDTYQNHFVSYQQVQQQKPKFQRRFEQVCNCNEDDLELFLNQLINYSIANHQKEVIHNIRKPLGFNLKESISELRLSQRDPQFFNKLENDRYILDTKIFINLSKKLMEIDSQGNRRSPIFNRHTQHTIVLQHSFNQAIYDCLNQILDEFRPYSLKGRPILKCDVTASSTLVQSGLFMIEAKEKLLKLNKVRASKQLKQLLTEDEARIAEREYAQSMDLVISSDMKNDMGKWGNEQESLLELLMSYSQFVSNRVIQQQLAHILKLLNRQ